MTPLDWLAADFSGLLERDPRARVALWFDAKAEFAPVLEQLAARLAQDGLVLLTYAPEVSKGALWLKWAAEMGPGAEKRVVIWLPFARESLTDRSPGAPRLDCLLEYRFVGLEWLIEGKPPTLFGFLKKHGVPLPASRAEQDQLWRGGAESALAKYLRAHLRESEAFWQSRQLSLAVIEESIVGNVEDRLLRFLADPVNEWDVLSRAGIGAELCSQVGARYLDTAGLADDPRAWAESFVVALAALEVFEATGGPADFPFATKLPPEPRRLALAELLRRWMQHRDHFESFRRWSGAVESAIDLRAWARGRQGRPQALRSLAGHRWKAFRDDLLAQGSSETALQLFFQKHREDAVEEAKGFWARGTGDLPGWQLAVELADLVTAVVTAVNVVSSCQTAQEVVARYETDWHRIDLAHWRLLAAARKVDEMEPLAAVADRFYVKYLDAVNRKLYETIRERPAWPPIGCRGVSEVSAELFATPSGKRAVLVVDALRFDLAAALQQRLDHGALSSFVANVPSETFVGMTSLLPPVSASLKVEDDKPALLGGDGSGDLSFRASRWKVLEAAGAAPLGKEKKAGRLDEVRHLLDLQEPPKVLPKLLVLFARDVDTIGHGAGYEVLHHFEVLLDELAHAIRRLRAWGYDEIHVVTDHGFVLLQKPLDFQPVEAGQEGFAVRNARYGLVPAGTSLPVATVPFPLDTSWSVALPPGVRCFSSPGRYFHGGATLQEVVVPHLRLVYEPAQRRSRMRVRASLPQVEIATLSVKVELTPVRPAPESLFDAEPEPITVRVVLGELDAPRCKPKLVEIRPDMEALAAVVLFLKDEPAIPAGTELKVHVVDKDTDESYATGLFVRARRSFGGSGD